jgi:hypothetical protein
MSTPDVEQRWRSLSEEVITSMTDWRTQHPKATLAEIEGALDERLDRLRVRMLEDSALASEQADWAADNRPCCPDCGQPVQRGGQYVGRLQRRGKQEVTLTRQYGVCPACGRGLFPPG